MILSFKDRFVEKILSGSKIHTIRLDPHDRWKPGNKIHFATGIRTKNYKQFFEGECKSVQLIEFKSKIDLTVEVTTYIDKKEIDTATLVKLIKNDGFDLHNFLGFNELDFFNWFLNKKNNYQFIGKIIHWTNFKY